MGTNPDLSRDLIILDHLEEDPEATQASLASQLGVAVGTINWHLKRLIAKGYIKASRVERRKLRYVITTEGIALRAHLTIDYIQNSFRLYRLVRQRMLQALDEVTRAGYSKVQINGNGDVEEVCRLTCLDKGVVVSNGPDIPDLEVHGLKVFVHWPDDGHLPDISGGRSPGSNEAQE
ncbi:MAG: winged helix-turn-helix transcriptional regulator [Anaerolineaceae bacterium]